MKGGLSTTLDSVVQTSVGCLVWSGFSLLCPFGHVVIFSRSSFNPFEQLPPYNAPIVIRLSPDWSCTPEKERKQTWWT